MQATGDGARRSTLRITAGSAVLLVVALLMTLVLRNVFVAAIRVLGWTSASLVAAILLMSPVRWLARFVPRVVALLLVGLTVVGVVGVLVYAVFDDVESETVALERQGPVAAARLEGRDDRIGELARDLRLVERAEDAFTGLRTRFGVGPEVIASAVGTVPSYLVCFILTVFFILYGPTIVRAGVDQIDGVERRRRMERAVDVGVERGRSYLWWALGQGALVGLAVLSFLSLLELPTPTVLALVAAVFAMVPYIGIVIGLTPTLLVVAGFEPAAVVAGLVLVGFAAQGLEAFVVRRVVDRRTLHVGPAIPVIVGAIGLEAYGIGGALYGAALAVILLALADSTATDVEGPLPTPNQDWRLGRPVERQPPPAPDVVT